MRIRDLLIIIICITFAASLIVIGGSRLDYINSKRQELDLISNKPLENAPPSLAFATVAMGAFRGLVVDILWMRAEKLKNEGQFFDAKQLADWITTLQPRFGSVWVFQAWNMAYNISVAIPASQPDQRWKWVKNGYELLRDKGIEINPHNIEIYQELAFIFQHKIGSVTDEVHKYYKIRLAEAIEPLISPADTSFFKRLNDAPAAWSKIIEEPGVKDFVEQLRKADESFQDVGPGEFVSKYLSLRQNPGRFKPEAFDVIDAYRGRSALEKFDIFAKAYQLRHQWKLEPALMQELNNKYGPVEWDDPNKHHPLDWRHPDTHAMYWAVKGIREAGIKQEDKPHPIAELNTDRILNAALQNLFRRGRIYIYKSKSETPDRSDPELVKEIYLRPDLRMFHPYNRHLMQVIEKYSDPNEHRHASLQTGHRNMLENALFTFYQAGHKKQARNIFNQLRRLYPRKQYNKSLEAYVRARLIEEIKGKDVYDFRELLQAMLRESYFFYAMRDDRKCYNREEMAKQLYDYYKQEVDPTFRIDLPEMPRIRYLALLDFLNDSQYPPSLREQLLKRIKIERPDLYERFTQQEEKLRKEIEKAK